MNCSPYSLVLLFYSTRQTKYRLEDQDRNMFPLNILSDRASWWSKDYASKDFILFFFNDDGFPGVAEFYCTKAKMEQRQNLLKFWPLLRLWSGHSPMEKTTNVRKLTSTSSPNFMPKIRLTVYFLFSGLCVPVQTDTRIGLSFRKLFVKAGLVSFAENIEFWKEEA